MKSKPKIVKTLLLSSSAIAITVAIFTLFFEYSQIEGRVMLLAKKELHRLITHLDTKDNDNFIDLKLYSLDKKLIFENTQDEYEQIQKDLLSKNHQLVTKKDKESYEKVRHNQINNKFYFEFKKYVKVKNFEGYIQGLYEIPNTEINSIYKALLYSVLQVIVTVFVTTLLLYPIIVYLNKAYIKKSEDLLHANLEIMSVLGGAIAKRDSETNAHNYRVTLYAIAFAEKLKLSNKDMTALIKGAFLHDVGKIGVSDTILLKPGKLNEEEFSLMKKHVVYGGEILQYSRWLDDAKDVVMYHHEQYNGEGYNAGIEKEDIPLNARIFMICDVFDALTSKRPYKHALSFDESLAIIQKKSGTHFDPKLVKVFTSFIEKPYKKIFYLEDEDDLKRMLDEKLYYFDID